MAMIENSERGITLNKSLAWTIVVGLIGAGVWLGGETTKANSGIEMLQEQVAEVKTETKEERGDTNNRFRAVETRVRSLEGNYARQATSATHVNSELKEVQQQLRENNQLLRRLLQQYQGGMNR